MAQGSQCLTGRQESAKNSLDLLVMHLWYLHIVFRMLIHLELREFHFFNFW